MSLTMEDYLKLIDSSVKEHLEEIFKIEQQEIKVASGMTQKFKELREDFSKQTQSASMKKEHADQAKAYGDEITESQLKTHKLYGDLVQKSQELLRLAQQGFKEVYGIKDREKDKLKREIKQKHGPSVINTVGTKNRDEIDLVWEGRNQSVHVKDGLRTHITTVFKDLENDFPAKFNNFLTDNKAYEVVSLLDWLLEIEEVTPEDDIDSKSPGYPLLQAAGLDKPLPEPKIIGYDKFREFMLRLG